MVHIPDDLAARLCAGGDLSRRALEALALEEYRSGRIGKADLSVGLIDLAESFERLKRTNLRYGQEILDELLEKRPDAT